MAIHLKDSNNESGRDCFKIHSKIAETICDIIEKSDLKDCSFNMGLFGNWGSGKSFIINKIKEKLSQDKYLFLNIDVWKFVDNPLLRCILFDVNKQLKEKARDIFPDGYTENKRDLESILYYEEKLKNEIPISFQEQDKKIIKWVQCNKPFLLTLAGVLLVLFVLSILIPETLIQCLGYWGEILKGLFKMNSNLIGIIVGIVGIMLYPLKKLGELVYCGLEVQNYKTLPNFSPEQFERIFFNIANEISMNNKKLIIVFDNLDRCEPKYAYETLSTIKTFMDVKSCFYIIPCDDNAVKQYISNNYSIMQNDKDNKNEFVKTLGVEFFDKLFDTYIRIPILEEIDRDNFIEEQLKLLDIYEELKDDIRNIRQILYYGYKGATPRQIKKFINDFSTYYMLAKNIDPNKLFLLNDIPFFAIMLVIKQKWSSIENELIKVPKLVNNSQIVNNDDFKLFINKVEPLIPQPLPPLLPFIYLKETTNEQSINEKLKNGEIIEDFNENVYKRIRTEIDNILVSKDNLYILQAANSTFGTLIKYKDSDINLKKDFIRTIGKLLSALEKTSDFAKFILKNKNSIDFLYNSFIDMYLKEKQCVKSNLLHYLKEDNDVYLENQVKIFTLILSDKTNLFSNVEIQSIFSKIEGIQEITKNIQSYVELAFNYNKQKFIPKNLLLIISNAISNNGIPESIKSCVSSFRANNLPDDIRSIIAQKTVVIAQNLANRLSINSSDSASIAESLIDCLMILYKKDISEQNYSNFMNILYSIIERMRKDPDVTRKKYSYSILIEMFWFVDNDNKFSSILTQFIVGNKELFIDKIKTTDFSYIVELFKHELSQKVLLSDKDISFCLYETFNEKIPQNYMIFLRKDCNIENLDQLLKYIQNNNISINKIEFRDAIVQKYIENNVLELILDAFLTLNQYGYDVTKKQRLSIKNKLIDFYKEDPKSGIMQLGKMKDLLSEDEFSVNILVPIFNHIKAELNATHSVAVFSSIAQLINKTFIINNLEIMDEIINKLSDDNQEIAEYELCLSLIQLLQIANKDIDKYREKIKECKNYFNENLINVYNSLYSTQDKIENEIIDKT